MTDITDITTNEGLNSTEAQADLQRFIHSFPLINSAFILPWTVASTPLHFQSPLEGECDIEKVRALRGILAAFFPSFPYPFTYQTLETLYTIIENNLSGAFRWSQVFTSVDFGDVVRLPCGCIAVQRRFTPHSSLRLDIQKTPMMLVFEGSECAHEARVGEEIMIRDLGPWDFVERIGNNLREQVWYDPVERLQHVLEQYQIQPQNSSRKHLMATDRISHLSNYMAINSDKLGRLIAAIPQTELERRLVFSSFLSYDNRPYKGQFSQAAQAILIAWAGIPPHELAGYVVGYVHWLIEFYRTFANVVDLAFPPRVYIAQIIDFLNESIPRPVMDMAMSNQEVSAAVSEGT